METIGFWKKLFGAKGAPKVDIAEPFANTLGMNFVPVPGTQVQFCIWETRVTDFEKFVNATGYDATQGGRTLSADGWGARGGSWKSPGFAQTPDHPVCCVNWDDAKAFCIWLTEKERAEGLLRKGQGYRLPTDAEWSVAVGLPTESGGTPKFKDGKVEGVYPWGTQWPPPAGSGNYAGEEVRTANTPKSWEGIKGYRDGHPRTSPVGSFAPNSLALYDMGGNVWEFCEDFFDGLRGPRVVRGGCWWCGETNSTLSSVRYAAEPGTRSSGNGFRCVFASGVGSASR